MTDTTQTDPEIVGELHYRGDIRHADFDPVGPTADGHYFAPVVSGYDPETDITTVHYERARVDHFREGIEVPAAFGGGRR